MNKSGSTPLFRAKNIENLLGIKEIYLKLEGSNPFGHKYDRIAETIIKDARGIGKKTVLVDGPKTFINSIRAFAELEDIIIRIPQFRNQTWKASSFPRECLIDLRNVKKECQQITVEQLCEKSDFYNGATGYHNTHLSVLALEEIGDELIDKIDNISTVFVQLSYGYTISSLYNSFFRGWVKGDLDHYPRTISCTIPKGNKIYEDYLVRNAIQDIEDYDLKINNYSRDLYIEDTQLLEEALKAIRDTEGEIVTIDEKLLKESCNLLRTRESITLTTEESYSFAGFYKLAKQGKLSDGKHIILLNNGRSDIKVKRVESFTEFTLPDLVKYVDAFLMQYSDPLNEIEDALRNAMKRGAVFVALMNNEPQGIAVVVHTGFSDFIPTYHLGYIGTHTGRKGRGIASCLLDEVIDFTGGNVSLHVDMNNNRAKKLYEKWGFKHKYNRMLFQK
ncbi:MAG: GNAT family N-acetyltransferase [Candidatus Wallbacteria bacterium HGW-Wallbacteria-1]|jgi:threonine synthase|uniref:GNAT family N-acetyltransferase n=1 Tax=Candidatus Wallbacteria bacterium HGW-Wallbacteria-1 TaxID=2013854 RepID=A0A2N1PIV0_9BACT|nr:MAG: GNAT family N-acetyltransferase [Candidatus Wallbacteria bacterium HGW-Wallbacteria-1]